MNGVGIRLSMVVCGYFLILMTLRADVTAPGFTETTVASGLDRPTAIAFLPDGRMLVAEQGGSGLFPDPPDAAARLSEVRDGQAVPLVEIPVAPYCDGAEYEVGLLGIAVDPAFAENGHIFLYRTRAGSFPCFDFRGDATGRFNEIVRVTMSPEGAIELNSMTVLLAGIRTETGYHNGGCLRIGPDGKLYASTGENGVGDFGGGPPGNSTNPFAQDLNALEGKILRLNRDGSIPADNPYAGQAGKRGEIFASGFRNPWRFGFDPRSGRLWAGDVGEDDVEEIDIVASGGNYGWPRCEGNLPQGCSQAGDAAPVYAYRHRNDPDQGGEEGSVTGGAFAGPEFGEFAGDYFYGDYAFEEIFRIRPNGSRTGVSGSPAEFVSGAGGPVDLVFGPDGALYYVAFAAGEVRRVASSGGGLPSGGEQALAGSKLILSGGARKKLKVLSKDSIVLGGSLDDPTVAGGSLRIISDGYDDAYPLPAANWKAIGKPGAIKGYKYQDKKLENGPINGVQIKGGKLFKASGLGPGLLHELGESAPSAVGIVLELGTRRFCMSFGGEAKYNPAKLQLAARNAPAPAQCPAESP